MMQKTSLLTQPLTEVTRKERVTAYFLFARLFREAPSETFLKEITPEDFSQPQEIEKIAVEFARLFCVPGDQAVRPYESVYCDTLSIDTSTACSAYFASEPLSEGLKGFLGGKSTTLVREACRGAGFELDPTFHDLPDHLSVELEFLGRLVEAGREKEVKEFFITHLGHWVFQCLNDIKQKTHSGFYRMATEMLIVFLQREQKFLQRDLDHKQMI